MAQIHEKNWRQFVELKLVFFVDLKLVLLTLEGCQVWFAQIVYETALQRYLITRSYFKMYKCFYQPTAFQLKQYKATF